MTKEPEFIIENEILPIIATYYPFSLEEIKMLYDRQEVKPSFDWVMMVCDYALWRGLSDLEIAEREMIKGGEDSGLEERVLDAAFDEIKLKAEVKRLEKYTDPKLFAAASGVLEAWDDYNQVDLDSLIEALEEQYIPRLIEAVAWWDSLPHKIEPIIPPYEG